MTAAQRHTQDENNRISLCRYFETLLQEYKDAHVREHALIAENTLRIREALEVRLEGMNQFRAQIMMERGNFVTQDKYDAQHQALTILLDTKIEVLEKRLGDLESTVSNMRGRFSAIATAVTVGLVIVQIVLHFLVK